MFQTTTERDCRAFAAEFDTPNVRQAIRLAEAGRVSWDQLYGLFHKSLSAGLSEVRS